MECTDTSFVRKVSPQIWTQKRKSDVELWSSVKYSNFILLNELFTGAYMSKTKEKNIIASRNIMRLSPLLFTLAVVSAVASKSFSNLHQTKIIIPQVNLTILSAFASSVTIKIFWLPMLNWLNDAFSLNLSQVPSCFSLLLPLYHQPM